MNNNWKYSVQEMKNWKYHPGAARKKVASELEKIYKNYVNKCDTDFLSQNF